MRYPISRNKSSAERLIYEITPMLAQRLENTSGSRAYSSASVAESSVGARQGAKTSASVNNLTLTQPYFISVPDDHPITSCLHKD